MGADHGDCIDSGGHAGPGWIRLLGQLPKRSEESRNRVSLEPVEVEVTTPDRPYTTFDSGVLANTRTDMVARFSTVAGERDGVDTQREPCPSAGRRRRSGRRARRKPS